MHGTIPYTPPAAPGSGSALVEAQPDPRTPGRVGYRISHHTSPGAVQGAVAAIMGADGVRMSQFTHVRKSQPTIGTPPVFFSVGYTLTHAPMFEAV